MIMPYDHIQRRIPRQADRMRERRRQVFGVVFQEYCDADNEAYEEDE